MSNEFGKYLSDFLDKNDYRIESFAKKVGYSTGLISHYTTGKRSPSYKFIETFFQKFNFSIEEKQKILEIVDRDKIPISLQEFKSKEKSQMVSPFNISDKQAIELGKYLKKRREKLDYSTNYIEIHTGIDKANLSRIENGKKKKINPLYLKELAKILKLNQIEVFDEIGYIDDEYLFETKKKEISKFIENFMEKNNYKLEYLSEMTGFSVAAIGHYKTGARTPKDDFVEKFIEVFKLNNTETEKLKLAVAMDRTPDLIKRKLILDKKIKDPLYKYIDMLSEEQRKIIEPMLKGLVEKK